MDIRTWQDMVDKYGMALREDSTKFLTDYLMKVMQEVGHNLPWADGTQESWDLMSFVARIIHMPASITAHYLANIGDASPRVGYMQHFVLEESHYFMVRQQLMEDAFKERTRRYFQRKSKIDQQLALGMACQVEKQVLLGSAGRML